MRIDTSAKSRGGRVAVPAKITSSMPPPRSDLGLDSPIAHRIASSRFDLPQPFGPTTPVRPGSILSSAGSTKLLKPLSFSRRMRKLILPRRPRLAPRLLQERLQRFPVVGRHLLAVDEEGRCALDSAGLRGLHHLRELVGCRLVLEARLRLLLRNAVRCREREQTGNLR